MKTFLVTGANSGLGFELTRALAARGERVLMASRDLARGEAAKAKVLAEHPSATLEVLQLDLADAKSIRTLTGKPFDLDVLINNAGMGWGPPTITPEGVTTLFASNHLGHFALTAQLFPRLAKRPGARIVTVTSGFAKNGRLDFANFDGSRGYRELTAYSQSKVANVLFGIELDRRIREAGLEMKSVLAHPGIAATQMQQKPTGLMGVFSKLFSRLFAQSADKGVLPLLQSAIDPDVESGAVYGPKGKEIWPSTRQFEDARRLWERSEALTQGHGNSTA